MIIPLLNTFNKGLIMSFTIHRCTNVILLTALAAGSAVADSVARGSFEPDVAIAVKISDLDLDSDSGMQTLRARVGVAARRACLSVSGDHAADFHEMLSACYRHAVARALDQVQTTRVAALHTP